MKLEIAYQVLDDVKAGVEKAQPKYRVLAVPRGQVPIVLGNGKEQPDLVFEESGDALPVYKCLTLVHPYWKEVENERNPNAPGDTQVTSSFVPGVSDSRNLTGAPMPPKVVPPPEPTTPPAPVDQTPRDPVDCTFWGFINLNDTVSGGDTQGVYGNDTMLFPFAWPANRSNKTISFAAVEFPAGPMAREVAVKQGERFVYYGGRFWGVSVNFSLAGLPPADDYTLVIRNHGESWRPGNMRLQVNVG